MSSGEYVLLTEIFANGSFAKEDKNASEEIFSNESPVKRFLIEEDEMIPEEVFTNGSFGSFVKSDQRGEDVFTNGSLPKSLTSAPLLQLYETVVKIYFSLAFIFLIININFLHIFFELIKTNSDS